MIDTAALQANLDSARALVARANALVAAAKESSRVDEVVASASESQAEPVTFRGRVTGVTSLSRCSCPVHGSRFVTRAQLDARCVPVRG